MSELARLLLDHTNPLGAAVLVGDDNPLTVAGGINAAVGSLYVSRTTGGVYRKRSTSATGWASITDRFHIKDFGAVCDSVADDTAAIQNAITAARVVGADVVVSGRPRVTAPLDLTFASGAVATTRRPIRIVFEEGLAVGPAVDPASSCLIVDHNGVVFDCTGSYDLVWENPNIATVAGRTPSCGWLLARNVGGGNGGQHTFYNPRAWGSFVNGVVYSYASEVNTYHAPRFYNLYAGGEIWCVTAANIRGLASTFTTIATGVKSNINLNVHDGAASAQNTGGRVFYLDRADLVVARWDVDAGRGRRRWALARVRRSHQRTVQLLPVHELHRGERGHQSPVRRLLLESRQPHDPLGLDHPGRAGLGDHQPALRGRQCGTRQLHRRAARQPVRRERDRGDSAPKLVHQYERRQSHDRHLDQKYAHR
jgi:hypothetical protein